ncbi:MAG: hypothetical protein L3J18_06555 [Candidatus Brocadia sp.]|uniref:NADH dehydrogenase subunit n=1 Tax=Candidatus Brocadia fulgida TaxID=380242 RepID=A0A0M2UU79_9BACT|nr:MAG: NADH dehydrogenase subunit [Candidatus Brocadia fulgida]MCC6325928.1 hypothetical protein [Candidatus Brocadia sp.]MCE7912769.1 hypothetical protein [Candidatus Brocadia sp. AMX3]MBV6519442.1 hypothetical protein [Candidatus Brocadia fulgida]MDG5997366.1 hypothetical protein [Candidatus Brocadia sp.]
MDEKHLITYLAHYFVLFPLLKVLAINIQYFSRKHKIEEHLIRRLVAWGGISDIVHVVVALSILGFKTATVHIESFCLIGWPFIVDWNLYTATFLAFTTILVTIIGRFSLFYLHRDVYYHKFFSLYFVFQLALGLLVLSSSTSYLFMGWELLGISSVLLIAFYEHRPNPLKNGMRVMFIYEFGDIFLFALTVILLYFHIEDINDMALIQKHGCEWAKFLLIVACFFKSGIFPWIWIPRAMEGPTPSSAIFYGSLSTHMPILLLLRMWPREWSLPACWPEVWTITHPANAIALAIAICVFSAFVTTHMSRQHSDAKNTVAYAITTQLAIIYIEIFLGFYTLALIHVISHGIYRTYEYMRTPSLFHLYHTMETRRPRVTGTGKHFESILPERFRKWLYALTINEFGFLSRSFDLIDQFLGLKCTSLDKKAARRFAIIISAVWIVFSIVMFVLNKRLFNVQYTSDGSGNTVMSFIINWNYFSINEELILVLAVGFCALSFYHIRRIAMYFITLACSAWSAGLVQALELIKNTDVKHLWSCVSVITLAIVFVGLACYSAYASSHSDRKQASFTAQLYRTPLSNALLFLLGLTIVGMPGLGTFLGWEHLVHYAAPIAPHTVVKGFFILKLNTILVVLFYFSNFLGYPDHKTQALHHYKRDTLHLRWAQKHTDVYPFPS